MATDAGGLRQFQVELAHLYTSWFRRKIGERCWRE